MNTVNKGFPKRTFVMGDIHGAYKALEQCLERSSFDKDKDTLIQLGDVADGFEHVYDCVEELLKIRNLISIKGNHDEWLNQFILTGCHPMDWVQGGAGSALSYVRQIGRKKKKLLGVWDGVQIALNPDIVPESHRQFFQRQQLYFIDEFNNCFVHGGFDRHKEFKGQIAEVYYWDRELWLEALADSDSERYRGGKGKFRMVTEFNNIFIGHTSTMNWKTDKPMKAANIYNLDTGAGCAGRLTIMDIKSKKFWQSDPVRELYCR